LVRLNVGRVVLLGVAGAPELAPSSGLAVGLLVGADVEFFRGTSLDGAIGAPLLGATVVSSSDGAGVPGEPIVGLINVGKTVGLEVGFIFGSSVVGVEVGIGVGFCFVGDELGLRVGLGAGLGVGR